MSAVNSTPIHISVDDETIRDLLPGYLDRRHEEVEKLKQLISIDDFQTIRIIGHNLKGSGSLYSLDKLSEIGADLESAALAQNQENLTELHDQMQDYLSRVQIN